MDPLDKLELILESTIKRKKRELKLGTEKGMHPASIHIYGIEKQIDAFEESLAFVRQVKRSASSMSDEMVLKMYNLC